VLPLIWVYLVPLIPSFSNFIDRDRRYWSRFWGLCALLEWLVFVIIAISLRKNGQGLFSIGFPHNLKIWEWIVGIGTLLLFLSIAFIGSGRPQEFLSSMPKGFRIFIPPPTFYHRLFWVGLALTAAICEETIWRGFGIIKLYPLVRWTWLAVLLSACSFTFYHGGLKQGYSFIYRFVIAMIFSLIFLKTKSLKIPIYLHFWIDAFILFTT
jgi:membrane protease YdiL (CAAX protease family)